MQAPAEATSWRKYPSIWVGLLLAAALGWIVTIQQAGGMMSMSNHMGGMSSAHPSSTAVIVFLPVWIAMMVGMMFPAVAPVVSLVAVASRKRREAGRRSVPLVVFLAGYLAIWTLFGVCANLLSLAVPSLDMAAPGIRSESWLGAGVILVAAGLYEWSPLKGACLRHCRSPLGTFMRLWRDGWMGAFRMGFMHGAICLGCCWGLMLVLFAVGIMNLGAMVLLAAVIFAQKVLPHGELVRKGSGLALIVAGLAFALTPVL